jgi:hypothetical protein
MSAYVKFPYKEKLVVINSNYSNTASLRADTFLFTKFGYYYFDPDKNGGITRV